MNYWDILVVPFAVAVLKYVVRTESERVLARIQQKLTKKPMETYSQRDPRWAGLHLGDSPYKMGEPGYGWGCTTTAVAQLLALAGHAVTPADVVNALGHAGYTDARYPYGGAGLIKWKNPGVEGSFPAFHWNAGGPYRLWSGSLGVYRHWVAEKDGVFYEPVTGRSTTNKDELTAFCGVRNLVLAYSCAIDEVVPVTVKRTATVTVKDGRGAPANINVRENEHGGVVVGKYLAGETFEYTEIVQGWNYEGNDKWLKTDRGYVWAAGTSY